MVRRAYANGDIYLGTYEGWYCPNEGFRNATDVVETARGTICPNHPDVPLQWLTEKNWFFRLSAYQERLERHFADHPDFVQPDFRRNEMLGFIRGGLEDFSISRERTPGGWGIPFPIAENGEPALREDGTVGPGGRRHLRLVRRAHQLHHRRRLPGRPGLVRAVVAGRRAHHRQGHRPVPHDLLAGDAVERRPRGAAAGLGPRLPACRRRRADEQEPRQLPGSRTTSWRRSGPTGRATSCCARCRSTATPRSSWDSFVRRYNADLANDFGNLVNRTVSMTNRYLDAERPAPTDGSLEVAWQQQLPAYQAAIESCRLHDALAGLVGVRRGGQPRWSIAEKPWELAKAAKDGDEAAAERLRGVLGDLLEACRLVGLAVAPYMPGVAPRVLAQLGYAYGYGPDGNGGPPILDDLVWGARAAGVGPGDRTRAALPAARRRSRGLGTHRSVRWNHG